MAGRERGCKLGDFFAELRRRNVFRVSAMYVVVAWLSMQVIAVMTPALMLPDWVDSFIAVLFIAGFPISMLIAWAFEITPDGVVRTETVPREQSIRELTGRRMDYMLFAGLLAVGGLIIFDRLVPETPQNLSNVPISEVTERSATGSLGSYATIAVLPFTDMSQTQDQKYFSDGVAEEILNLLVKVDDLQVISRTLSFSFEDDDNSLGGISQQYNISHFLDGSVRKDGDSVRISVSLIDAVTNVQAWSKTYTDKIDSIFNLQEEIAKSVAGELKIALDIEGQRELADSITSDPASYDLFLEGRNLYRYGYAEPDVLLAIEKMERAVELDPEFAEAWSLLGQAYLAAPAAIGSLDPDTYMQKAEDASQRGLDLDPELSLNYATLGNIKSLRGDQIGALEELKKGERYNPKDTVVLANIGLVYLISGRADLAESYLETMAKLDPFRPSNLSYLAMAKRNLRKYDESDFYAQKAAESGYIVAYDILARNAYEQDDPERAMEQFMLMPRSGAVQLSQDFQAVGLWEAGARAYFGKSEKDRQALQSLFTVYLDSENSIVNGFLVYSLLRIGLPDLYIEKVSEALSSSTFSMTAVWDESEESQLLRQSENFPAFAERFGLIEFWDEVGWPSECERKNESISCT